MKKTVVLSLVQLPPPLHGAAAVNLAVVQSDLLNTLYDQDHVPIQLSSELSSVGFLTFGKLGKVLSNFFKVWWRLRTLKPDLVYFTLPPHGGGFFASVPLVMVIKMYGIPCIYHFHGKGFKINGAKSRIYTALMRYLTANSDVILLSPKLLDDAKSVLDVARYHFIPNFTAIEPSYCNSIEQEEPAPLKILFLSNLVMAKGPIVLLDAAAILKENGIPFALRFAGNCHPPLDDVSFWRSVSERGLSDQVVYEGPVYGEAKQILIRQADVLVLPTYYENEAFPLVILEAMAGGLPVVATNEGAISDMVDDGVTGFLIKAPDSVLFAEALTKLSENPTLRADMGRSARKSVELNFTAEKFEQRMAAAWRSALVR